MPDSLAAKGGQGTWFGATRCVFTGISGNVPSPEMAFPSCFTFLPHSRNADVILRGSAVTPASKADRSDGPGPGATSTLFVRKK